MCMKNRIEDSKKRTKKCWQKVEEIFTHWVYRYESHGHLEASYCLAAFRLLGFVHAILFQHMYQIHIGNMNMMELDGLKIIPSHMQHLFDFDTTLYALVDRCKITYQVSSQSQGSCYIWISFKILGLDTITRCQWSQVLNLRTNLPSSIVIVIVILWKICGIRGF